MRKLSLVGLEFVADHIAANRFAGNEKISEVLDMEQPCGEMAAPQHGTQKPQTE